MAGCVFGRQLRLALISAQSNANLPSLPAVVDQVQLEETTILVFLFVQIKQRRDEVRSCDAGIPMCLDQSRSAKQNTLDSHPKVSADEVSGLRWSLRGRNLAVDKREIRKGAGESNKVTLHDTAVNADSGRKCPPSREEEDGKSIASSAASSAKLQPSCQHSASKCRMRFILSEWSRRKCL
eukprot:2979111-Rhodomonas_salina.1